MSYIYRSKELSYFRCDIDPDRIADEAQEIFEAEYERDQFLKRHDPNRIDGRHIKRKRGIVIENLGLRVNKLDASCLHW